MKDSKIVFNIFYWIVRQTGERSHNLKVDSLIPPIEIDIAVFVSLIR